MYVRYVCECMRAYKHTHARTYAQRERETLILVNCSHDLFVCFCFVCFVALRPKSTAMVIAGRSVHLTTLLHGQA